MEKLKRQTIQQPVDCNTERLYGPISDAIRYLQEIEARHPGTDISLEEHWFGYEDMEMRFVYWRDETNEEYEARCRTHRENLRQKREQERRAAERDADVKEFERLRRKLGR